MTDSSAPPEETAAALASELAALERQVVDTRASLARARSDLALADSHLAATAVAQLLAANEELVLSALKWQATADTSAKAFENLSRISELDVLTELPNRAVMLDRFATLIAHAKRRGTQAAVLFLDLDGFKQINDRLGHAAGDAALREVGRRLEAVVRQVDTVSRHGGDEFIVLLGEVSQPSDAALVAEKIGGALAVPHEVDGHVLRLAASIGIALYPADGEEAAVLIRRADEAMYRAKRFKRGRPVFYAEVFEAPLAAASVPGGSLLPRPFTYEIGLAEHEHRYTQLREANSELVLAALGAQALQSAAERAQSRQSEFLAMLAHEMRGPLGPLLNSATLLTRGGVASGVDLPKLQAVIERQVIHLSRMVDDLLDVSRGYSGKLRLEREALDFAEIVGEVVDAHLAAMQLREQGFHIAMPEGALPVWGDRIRLTQVLHNLLGNAAKYTPQGGEIWLEVRLAGDTLALTLADTGIGIPAHILPTVFEPFVQDPVAAGFSHLGLGIGLAVVRELVLAHGGDVEARSEGRGRGSTFVLSLPLVLVPASDPGPKRA
jgi:diguanylate cyclase (GGDEF)-like protein